MARKKSSGFEGLVAIAAKLPWWGGVILAILSYWLLHSYAIAPESQATPKLARASDLAGVAASAIIPALCSILQYVIPIAFVIGACISAWRSNRAKTLYQAIQTSPNQDRLSALSWREFEALVGQAYREKGYSVTVLGGNGPDGGVDLIARMGSDKYLVQCKHWRTSAVGVAPVRELFGVMVAEKAAGGFVVASGPFTSEAAKFADGRSIKLVDAYSLIKGVKVPPPEKVASPVLSPVCPRCGSAMVPRKSLKGPSAGSSFLGCSTYPKCKATLPN